MNPQRPDMDAVLDNGLRLVVARAPVVPLVEIRLSVPHAPERPGEVALRQLLAGCLLQDTETLTEDAFDDALAERGATLTAASDARRLTVTGHVLAAELPAVLRLLADGLRHPRLDEATVARQRDRLVRRIGLALAQPAALAQHVLLRHRYGAAAADLQPSVETVAEADAAALRALHRQDLTTAGATLVLVGDLDPEQAPAQVAEAFAHWPTAGAAQPPEPPAFRGGPLLPVHRSGAVQSLVRLAAPSIPRTDPDYPALHLAQLVFGGAISSRLVNRLREELGYAYRAGSGMESVPGAGTLMIEADVAAGHTAATLAEIRAALERMTTEPPTEAEVGAARRYAIGSTATAMSSPGALATGLSNLLHVGAGADWLSGWGTVLAEVGHDRVVDAAKRCFRPEDFTGVVVADLARLGGAEALGEAWPLVGPREPADPPREPARPGAAAG